MNDEDLKFLNLLRLPGTISAEQAAILLGVSNANIPILIAKKFLHPLGGRIKPNAPKRFSSHAIMKLVNDPEAMDRMHSILTVHYRQRNGGFGDSGLKSVA